MRTRAIRSASRAQIHWAHIYVNPNLEPWGNIHLRLAFNHAIDRDKYVEVVYENLHPANHWGYLGPALVGIHDPDEILIRYDPDRVREELALAGMPDGFAFDMSVPASGVTGAEFVQASLAQFGIELNIVVRPAPDYYIEFFEERTASFMSGMSVRADPWQQIAFLGRADGPFDFILPPGDKDAEVQAAFKKVTEIFDPEPRAEAFRELNRVMVSRAWHIQLNLQLVRLRARPEPRVRALRRRQATLRAGGCRLVQLGPCEHA